MAHLCACLLARVLVCERGRELGVCEKVNVSGVCAYVFACKCIIKCISYYNQLCAFKHNRKGWQFWFI